MAFVLKDRVRETSTTTGTGAFTLAGAIDGYQAFSSVCSTGDTFWYYIILSATSWEGGIGTYSGTNTLARTTVLESSNSGGAVNFGAGVKDVFIGFPSSKMLNLFDSSGTADQLRYNTAQVLNTTQINQLKTNMGFIGAPTGGFTTGDVKLTLKLAADSGWVMADDGGIGDASSGATTRANADTADLFALIWSSIIVTLAPIYTSAGVLTTKGASAAADFAAHKRLSLTKMLGRSLAISGSGSGLTTRSPGEFIGTETFTIDQTNIPNYNLSASLGVSGTITNNSFATGGFIVAKASDPNPGAGLNNSLRAVSGDPTTTFSLTAAGDISSGGSGAAITHREPISYLNVMIKL